MRSLISVLRVERPYIAFSAVLFCISFVLAVLYSDVTMSILKEAGLLDKLVTMSKSLRGHPSYWNAFFSIFFNNLLMACFAIGLGIFLAVFPLFAVTVNGFILGSVLMVASQKLHASPITVFIKMILPHGILELPAIILACAFGIHLGVAAIRRIIGLFSPHQLTISQQEWNRIRQHFMTVCFLVAGLILFAALIEAALVTFVAFGGKA